MDGSEEIFTMLLYCLVSWDIINIPLSLLLSPNPPSLLIIILRCYLSLFFSVCGIRKGKIMSSSHIMSGLMITWRRKEMRYMGLIFHMSNTLFQPFDVLGVWCKVYLKRSGILFTIDVPFTLQPEIISLHPMVFFSHPREREVYYSLQIISRGFSHFSFLICWPLSWSCLHFYSAFFKNGNKISLLQMCKLAN